ncbi:MAG: EAL domain-containing protein [Bryobacteraceae bacterium]|nr:EAL domain-containing protein [Bryobacteraceae bacterium]
MDSCSLCKLHSACGSSVSPEFDPWLDDALSADTFDFHFQPIVDVSSETIFAHEALVRLPGRNGGEIVAEAVHRKRIHAFDSYCRQKAIRTAATRRTIPDQRVFINFMPSSIYDPNHCLKTTMAAMELAGMHPEQVTFEVVESEEVASIPQLLRIRDFYRRRGFGFALDDCGTGSNTSEMVHAFRPDFIKLDKSLTSAATVESSRRELEAMLALGERLHCRVIAEGIETVEQMERLQSCGVTLMQGWLFGRPQPAFRKEYLGALVAV